MFVTCPYCRTSLNVNAPSQSIQCPQCRNMIPMSNPQNPAPLPYTGTAPGQRPNPVDAHTAFYTVSQKRPHITCKQLRDALEMTGLCISMDLCNQLLLKHDRDRSGRVDFNEFNAIVGEVTQWSGVFNYFDTNRSGRMEFKEFSDALVRLGYQFSQPIVSLMFTNLDINHAGFLDLNGFIKACTVIQIVMMKMQQYDPQKRGCVTLDVNQMMDVIFSIPMWSVFFSLPSHCHCSSNHRQLGEDTASSKNQYKLHRLERVPQPTQIGPYFVIHGVIVFRRHSCFSVPSPVVVGRALFFPLYLNSGSTQQMEFLSYVREKGYLPMPMLKQLCEIAKEILVEENTVQPVSSPVNICGDIHGQYSDLLELFRVGGEIPEKSYIFMGDYVDRGYGGCEVFQLLLSLKVCYPDKITLLRGNHESREITRVYGFYYEIQQKYNSTDPWEWCTDVFDYLGIAALVDNRILCIHGGLSPSISTIDQIRTLNRVMEIPSSGAFCDLLWSDPEITDGFRDSPRGAGYIFGEAPVNEFTATNGLELICRGHQMIQQGFQYMFSRNNLVTVWSAPNYCYRCENVASVLLLDEGLNRTFRMFKENKEEQEKEMQSSSYAFYSF